MNLSDQNLIVADTAAPLHHFAKNGYYQVGNRVFNHKILALQHATATKQSVHWNFNSEVYDSMDWTQKDSMSLLDMYRTRAEQVRNKYDYLILCWSGGGDSTTMLESFLHNNILIDEVVIMWPVSQSRGRYTAEWNTDSTNVLSEWELAIVPKLERLRIKYPNLKITICDTMSELNKNEYCDDTVLIVEKHNYGAIQRWRQLDQVARERSEKHNSVAIVLGVSPITTCNLDNKYLAAFFLDDHVNPGSKSDQTLDGWTRNVEYFYMTPDMPELVRKQAHVILEHMNVYPPAKNYVDTWIMTKTRKFEVTNRVDPEILRQYRKKLLYPNYDINTFQVRKQEDTHNRADWFEWFFKNPHAEEFVAPWRSAIQQHQALIDPKFLTYSQERCVGYVTFCSKLHIIGKFTHEIYQI
jgi:hypothetical protein